MNSPKKLYIVISAQCSDQDALSALSNNDGVVGHQNVFTTHKEAADHASWLNEKVWKLASDWRVETYVKGD